MSITYSNENRIFTLHTKNTTYQIQVGKFGHLLHLYYGSRIVGSMEYLLTFSDRGFSGNPYEADLDRTYSMDTLPQEYPTQGTGDYRTVCFNMKNPDGSYACDARYKEYNIKKGKYKIPGLPAIYANETEADTLEIVLTDNVNKMEITLLYGVLEELDIITRSVKIANRGNNTCVIEKAATACLDFMYGKFDLYTFYGRHEMERSLQKNRMVHGIQSIGSKRGTSSHQYNPFLIVADPSTTEDDGNCYGMCLVYSGGFRAEAELDQYNQTRIIMGLQDEMFSYRLRAGEDFYAPEVVMTFSERGLSKLSQNYHTAFREHLCRGNYKTSPRPVIINNWEATYFEFDSSKILKIAEQASLLGVEMLVLDDGWFGRRKNDFGGLGDWTTNQEKLDGSLADLVKKVNDTGMKFGLWMEPEMISEDSDLYRRHPDWAFCIPGRRPIRSRHQLVLDFSRKEVVDYIFEKISGILDSANIEYIKWDMNRSICDVYSVVNDNTNQGEVLYRYMLGLYDFLERIVQKYPNILIESCSGGGGRFDAGMLYYTPQIWCSDNSDAIDRIKIQEGTSYAYPISAVGSHVSAVPNHQTGRTTSLKTRGVVAMSGNFGYELDVEKLTEVEKEEIKKQITEYHTYWSVIHNGDYYRLTNSVNHQAFAAWEFVSKDKKEVLLNVVMLETHGNAISEYVKCKGLNPEAFYSMVGTDNIYSGRNLVAAGIPIPRQKGEYQSWQVYLKQVE